MEKLTYLCMAVRAISSHGEVVFRSIPDHEEHWMCIVRVGPVVLAESSAAPLSVALDEVTEKVRVMAERLSTALEDEELPKSV